MSYNNNKIQENVPSKGNGVRGGDKMTTKQKMYNEIELHGNNLKKIFNLDCDPIELCKTLRRLENKAHQLSTQWCNGEINEKEYDLLTDRILFKLNALLNFKSLNIPIFINGDARGYALKIDSDWVESNHVNIYKDWGGYGIIAPELRGK